MLSDGNYSFKSPREAAIVLDLNQGNSFWLKISRRGGCNMNAVACIFKINSRVGASIQD